MFFRRKNRRKNGSIEQPEAGKPSEGQTSVDQVRTDPNASESIMTAVADTLKRRKLGRKDAPESDSAANGESKSLAATVSPKLSGSAGASGLVRPNGQKFFYEPGSTPLPRYTIRRGLGVGGFGEVYFAVSEAGKEVALKRIQRNLEIELRGVSQCLNLKHPNLVALYDICRDADDQAWVVMEYVAGKNLREILDENPNGLPEPDARRWFGELAAGVDHLHRAGLVHRDMKPGNIFNDMGVVKVGDYGLSKFISASHRGGHTESVGTFHYMAPEIGRGVYGREIDIYALGVILFELLTGRVPFDGESCHEIIVKHLTALPDLTGVKNPYRGAIEAALQKDPNRRPSSVTEMLSMIGMGDGSEVVLTAKLADAPEPSLKPKSDATKIRPTYPAALDPSAGRAPSPSPSPVIDNPVSEEPIARAIRNGLGDLGRAWGSLERSPGAKTAVVIISIIVLILNTGWLLPLLSFVGVFYVPYYIIRNMVLHVRQQPTYAQAQRIADTHARPIKPLTRKQWCGKMRNSLRAKHSTTRLAELGTSSIVAVLTAVFLTLVAGVIGLRRGPVGAIEVAPYGLMAVVGIVSSLSLLLMGKLWEREEGESLRRRIALAGLGAGMGLVAFGLGQHLMVPMNAWHHRLVDTSELPQALYQFDGMPRASAYMAHFALLFAGLRWWRMVDPLRRRRLSLWSVSVAVVGEWLIHQILPVAQPAGMVLAGGIAIVVQMSAPWVNPELEKPVETTLPPMTPAGAGMAAIGTENPNA